MSAPPRPFMPEWFDGETYDPDLDEDRLKTQLWRVLEVMSDGKEHLLEELVDKVGGTTASVSARIRDLRKERFGNWIVARRRIPGGNGLHGYTLSRKDALVQKVLL